MYLCLQTEADSMSDPRGGGTITIAQLSTQPHTEDPASGHSKTAYFSRSLRQPDRGNLRTKFTAVTSSLDVRQKQVCVSLYSLKLCQS